MRRILATLAILACAASAQAQTPEAKAVPVAPPAAPQPAIPVAAPPPVPAVPTPVAAVETKKPAPPPPNVPPAPTAEVAADGIIGRPVLGPDGKEVGRVVDVLVDAGSNPRAAVIDFGGFLGVGTRRIAINWSDLTFPPTGAGGNIKLDLSAAQISSAPAYTDQTQPASVVEPPPVHAAASPSPAPAEATPQAPSPSPAPPAGRVPDKTAVGH